MKRCQLDPVFVFSADCEFRGQQFIFRVEKARRKISSTSLLAKLKATMHLFQLDLVLEEDAFVDLLNLEHYVHLRSPFCRKRSCAALAAALNCPLLSESVEYLVLCASAPSRQFNGFNFIPLSYANFETEERMRHRCSATRSSKNPPCSDATTDQCLFLHAHRFAPERTSIGQVHEFYRPLLFLLLGSDSIPRITLPSQVYQIMNTTSGDYKTRRWFTICNWLAKYTSNVSMEPINRIINTYNQDLRLTVQSKLSDSVQTYIPSPSVASRLVSLLSNTTISETWRSRISEFLKKDIPIRPNPSQGRGPVLYQLLRGSDFGTELDFTSDWSSDLTQAFTQSALLAKCITPVYVSPDILLPSYIGLPEDDRSVYEASLPLRLIHYRILLGLKHKLPDPDKSLDPHICVNEILSVSPNLLSRSVQVTPLYVCSRSVQIDIFLHQFLGLKLPQDVNRYSPLANLAIALAIWHCHSEPESSFSLTLVESPIALAILVCAVATWFNYQCTDLDESVLVQCYQAVGDTAENQATTSAGMAVLPTDIPPAYRLEFVHAYNSIQLVYASFRSLLTLLTKLVSVQNTSTLPSFTQTWIIFPSGRLVHWIASCLDNVDRSARRYQAMRFWMPRLLYRSKNISASISAQMLCSMSQEFTKLLDLACSVLLDPVLNSSVQFTLRSIPPMDYSNLFTPGTNDPPVIRPVDSLEKPEQPKRFDKQQRKEISQSLNSIPSAATKSVLFNSKSNSFNKAKQGKPLKGAVGFKRSTGYAARLQERLLNCEKENKMEYM
ncbi:unnamed protein product [Echinostoma caproni]|uniref:Anaphase-promoting complex subunit 1 n=1 Tax=Echinostoma caproni TaxID=27848 RepID=A0A183AUV7_9TREM|nr:unnamed protein product [Echinostoma caproni]